MKILFWTATATLALDQLIKFLVVQVIDLLRRQEVEVFPPYLVLRMAWNRGVNFGLFSELDMRWVLVGLALVISVAVLVWLWRSGGSRWHYVAGGLLIGGALGNVIDRVVYGAVADFLNMSCCGIDNPYAFNVADVAIFLGAIGLALLPEHKPKARTGK